MVTPKVEDLALIRTMIVKIKDEITYSYDQKDDVLNRLDLIINHLNKLLVTYDELVYNERMKSLD